MFKKLIKWLIYGGSFELSNYESWILDALKNVAEPGLANLLDEQTRRISYIQRHHNSRVIMLTIEENCALIKPIGDSDGVCIARMKFTYQKKRFHVNIFTVRGKLRTIETKQSIPPEFDKNNVSAICVDFYPDGDNHDCVDDLDQEEHG